MTTRHDEKIPSPSNKTHPSPKDLQILPNKNPNRRIPIYIVFLLLVCIAVSSAFLLLKTNMQARLVTSQQIRLLSNQLNALKQQQINDKILNVSAMKTINNSQNQLQLRINAFEENMSSVLQQRSYQTNDWGLLKVRYLLELAEINAHWSLETNTTEVLLQQADALLADIPGAQPLALRQALAKEIAEIQATPTLDLTGLLSQLDAAIVLVAKLPLKALATLTLHPDEAGALPDWKERLKNSVVILEAMVVIRHHDDDIQPLPSKAQESLLREEIRLSLQESQWALLQHNDALYHAFLAEAMEHITQSFATETIETKALLQQIKTLQKTRFIQKNQTLGPSLQLINQLIDAKKDSENKIKSPLDGVNKS